MSEHVNKSNKSRLITCVLSIFLLISGFIFHCSKNPTEIEIIPYTPPKLTNTTWEQIEDPETAGWSTEKLQKAYSYSQTIDAAAVMIIYNGKVLFYWGDITRKFYIHSCRKSLLSALIGIHVNNGNINLDKTMDDLGIDDSPPSLSETEKTATIRMLLKARSGIYHEAAAEAPSMKADRPERYSHEPGTFWYYNNWDFNALGTIFEQETGKKIFQEFKDKIADPIGMEDYVTSDGQYQYESLSIHPAYPFKMTARDMARFGLLFLRKGKWDDVQVIPENWVTESTTSYSNAGISGGYGYMWWVAANGVHIPYAELADGTFSARGYKGHYILIIPDKDLVIVQRVNTFEEDNEVKTAEFGLLVSYILEAEK